MKYSNAPHISLWTIGDVNTWEGMVWRKVGDNWISLHSDGRARMWKHNGQLTDRGTHVETDKQSGMYGDHYHLTMADDSAEWPGRQVVLRGPWHVGAPPDHHDVAMVNQEPDENRKWFQFGGTGGTHISTDLLLRIIGKFLPELDVYQIGDRIEPAKAEWGAPKAEWLARRAS
jgi:hypothetical protein